MLQHEIRASLGALLDLQCYELIGAILSASTCNYRWLINVFMRLGYSLNLQLRKPRTRRLHKVHNDLGSSVPNDLGVHIEGNVSELFVDY